MNLPITFHNTVWDLHRPLINVITTKNWNGLKISAYSHEQKRWNNFLSEITTVYLFWPWLYNSFSNPAIYAHWYSFTATNITFNFIDFLKRKINHFFLLKLFSFCFYKRNNFQSTFPAINFLGMNWWFY